MAVENFTLELDRKAVEMIRHALLVGLLSYGEIERVLDRIDGVTGGGIGIDDSFIPRHPTGSAETTLVFATALSHLN